MGKSITSAKFSIGQIVDHNRFAYRGVIVGVDPEFNLSEEWYAEVALSKPPKDRPWYHVLVDSSFTHQRTTSNQNAFSTYVAEQHLRPSDNNEQIDHPLLGNFFDHFNGDRYLSKSYPH